MERRKEEERKKNNRNKIWDIVKIIITAVVTALITLLFTNKNSSTKNQPQTPQLEQKAISNTDTIRK
jgi:flagellar basal body-associated protein FliL